MRVNDSYNANIYSITIILKPDHPATKLMCKVSGVICGGSIYFKVFGEIDREFGN